MQNNSIVIICLNSMLYENVAGVEFARLSTYGWFAKQHQMMMRYFWFKTFSGHKEGIMNENQLGIILAVLFMLFLLVYLFIRADVNRMLKNQTGNEAAASEPGQMPVPEDADAQEEPRNRYLNGKVVRVTANIRDQPEEGISIINPPIGSLAKEMSYEEYCDHYSMHLGMEYGLVNPEKVKQWMEEGSRCPFIMLIFDPQSKPPEGISSTEQKIDFFRPYIGRIAFLTDQDYEVLDFRFGE